MLKKLSLGAVAAAILLAPLVLAAPASAAELPSGDSLYAISCEQGGTIEDVLYYSDVYSVDDETAALTFIGNTGLDPDCSGPGAYDPTTGVSYYLSWDQGALAIVNLTTGAATPTTISGDSTSAPDGLAIGLDGKAWITWSDDLYSVDLATGVTTLVAPIGNACIYAFAMDPTSGKFYAIQCSSHAVYEIEVPSGVTTQIGTLENVPDAIFALQIDSSGHWWFEAEYSDGPGVTSLWSTARPSGETDAEYVGDFFDSPNEFGPNIGGLLITYPVRPLLPATGVEVTPLVISVVGLLAVGGALALVSARRRRSA